MRGSPEPVSRGPEVSKLNYHCIYISMEISKRKNFGLARSKAKVENKITREDRVRPRPDVQTDQPLEGLGTTASGGQPAVTVARSGE